MRRKKRILVVDNDRATVALLRRTLNLRGYETFVALDGAKGLQLVQDGVADLLIMEIDLPVMDGLELCKRVREWSWVPIIVLSAKDEQKDKVRCLDAGADDYITKPFGTEELMARIRTAFRHVQTPPTMPLQSIVTFGSVAVDIVNRQVTVDNREVRLTPTEYCLLKELVMNKGRVLTHQHLLSRIWGDQYVQESKYLHVFVRRLRLKLEPEPSNPRYFISVSGIGYEFVNPHTILNDGTTQA